MKISIKTFLIVFVTLNMAIFQQKLEAADKLQKFKQGLDIILDFSNDYCNKPSLIGNVSSTEISGDLNVGLDNLINKIIDLEFDVAAKYKNTEYKNLLQKDFIEAYKNHISCKKTMWQDLKVIVIPEFKPFGYGVSHSSSQHGTPRLSDKDLLSEHRKIFDRPAFRVSATDELSLEDLLNAIGESDAALNTGKLYSRDGKLRSEFRLKSEYVDPKYQDAFNYISQKLEETKRSVIEFQVAFDKFMPNYSGHKNFYAIFQEAAFRKLECQDLTILLSQADQIDSARNNILLRLNNLLTQIKQPPFELIKTSSELETNRELITISCT